MTIKERGHNFVDLNENGGGNIYEEGVGESKKKWANNIFTILKINGKLTEKKYVVIQGAWKWNISSIPIKTGTKTQLAEKKNDRALRIHTNLRDKKKFIMTWFMT